MQWLLMIYLSIWSGQNYTHASHPPETLPSEVLPFLNLSGTYIHLHQNTPIANEHGRSCEILLNPYADETVPEIIIESGIEFKPVANFSAAQKKRLEDGTVVYHLQDNGKRPGGSVCGDIGPLIRYSKIVEIRPQILLIRQNIWCLFDGHQTEIIQGCKIDNSKP